MEIKPKNYAFDDIGPGLAEEFSVKLTDDDVKNYANISGDFNPLHLDEIYASKTVFQRPIIHGMFLASLFSRLVGMYLPGKKSLYLSQTLNFRNPGYAGKELKISGVVTAKSEATGIIVLNTVIKNEDGVVLVDGEAKVKIL